MDGWNIVVLTQGRSYSEPLETLLLQPCHYNQGLFGGGTVGNGVPIVTTEFPLLLR